jgi:hypothetical protein
VVQRIYTDFVVPEPKQNFLLEGLLSCGSAHRLELFAKVDHSLHLSLEVGG